VTPLSVTAMHESQLAAPVLEIDPRRR
jgi:hypothetical protein